MSNRDTPDSARANAIELAFVLGMVCAVHLLPRLWLGQDSFVTIFDNLDSDLVYRVLIAKPGRLLNPDAFIPELVGGLPRWTYPSGLKLGALLFWALPTFWAYVVLETIVAALGALGMWLLLRDYLPMARLHRALIAITFGLLPFWSIYDLGVAGQAGVAWALFNLWFGQKRKTSLAICALFPFASVLSSPGAFVVALAAFLLGVAALVYRKTVTRAQVLWPLFGIFLMGAGYLIADHDFLYGLFFKHFVSHRSAWAETSKEGFSYDPMLLLWWAGRPYHVESRHTLVFAFTIFSAVLFAVRKARRAAVQLVALFVLATLISLTLNIFKSPLLAPVIAVVPALVQVTLRFWWSLALLWLFTLGVIAHHWRRTGLNGRWLSAFLAVELLWVLHNPISDPSELEQNYRALAEHVRGQPSTVFSYRQFVSADAFARIRQHVGPGDTGRFIALGFHPSVLALNGFDCADGYRDFYELAYKKRFRRLIAGELEQDEAYRQYFDDYGNRVYVFLRGKRRSYYHKQPKKLRGVLTELSLNEAAARDLGIGWIASTYRLEGNAALKWLRYEGKYADASGGFKIYLYRVRPKRQKPAITG
jgi:hypothetical protein